MKTTEGKIQSNLFASRLRTLREEKGMTQTDLANRAGVSRTNISNWETGQRIPCIKVVETIAKEFCVPMDYLYGSSDERYNVKLPDNFELDLTKLNNRGITRLHEYYKLLLDSPEYSGSLEE